MFNQGLQQISKEEKEELQHVLNQLERKNVIQKVKNVFFISGGLSTKNYKVENEEGKIVLLRMYPNKTDEHVMREYQIMSVIKESKLQFAPLPILVDCSKKESKLAFAVYSFMDGMQGSPQSFFGKDELIKQSGKILRMIHDGLPKLDSYDKEKYNLIPNSGTEDCTLFGKTFFDYNLIVPSEFVIETMKKFGMDNFKKVLAGFIQKATDLSKKAVESDNFQKCNRKTLIHGDFHVRNFLFANSPKKGENPEEVINVIDWEWARFGNQYEDIASFIEKSVFTEEHRKLFLSGYFKQGEKINEELLKLMQIRHLTLLFYFMLIGANKGKNEQIIGFLKTTYDRLISLLNSL